MLLFMLGMSTSPGGLVRWLPVHLGLLYLLHLITLLALFLLFFQQQRSAPDQPAKLRRKRMVTDISPIDDTHYALLPFIARVPVSVLDEFCRRGREHCSSNYTKSEALRGPPGLTGPRGPPGRDGKCSCKSEANRKMNKEELNEELNSNFSVFDSNSTPKKSSQETFKKTPKEMPVDDEGLRRNNAVTKRLKKKCYITGVGAKESWGKRNPFFGAWMKDTGRAGDKVWVTEHIQGISILEFPDNRTLRAGHDPKIITLPEMFDGTNHVFYNNAFYFHRIGTNKVVRAELSSGRGRERGMPDAEFQGTNYLYSQGENNSKSYMDLATDENGLWLIYRPRRSNSIAVSRLDPITLKVFATWKLPKRKADRIQNAFIACGILYAVEEERQGRSKISWAYDLSTRRSARLDMSWDNVGNHLSMVNYDPISRRIFLYDGGHMVTLLLDIYTENHLVRSPDRY